MVDRVVKSDGLLGLPAWTSEALNLTAAGSRAKGSSNLPATCAVSGNICDMRII